MGAISICAKFLIEPVAPGPSIIRTTETIIKNAIEPVMLDITLLEIRRELDYLEDRELLAVERSRVVPVWSAKINRLGVDLVEYTVPCDPGIARPEKWW